MVVKEEIHRELILNMSQSAPVFPMSIKRLMNPHVASVYQQGNFKSVMQAAYDNNASSVEIQRVPGTIKQTRPPSNGHEHNEAYETHLQIN